MSAALKLCFELVRHEHEDRRTDAVVAFARAVRVQLHILDPRRARVLSALVDCHEHRNGALEALAKAAIDAVPFVDVAHREGLARDAERIRALFRRGER